MRIFIAYLFMLIWASLGAQTTVSGNVSGTWTLANSPYLVSNNIGVPGGQTLVIQPGVQVIFQGFYRFGITGQLVAEGTANLPIIFSQQDTTGWFNDQQMAGGWRGLYFAPLAATDSSRLVHCIVKDVKHGLFGNANGFAALYIYGRGLTVRNCEFTHNQSIANASEGKIIVSTPSAGQSLTLESCYLHDNRTRVAMIFNAGPALLQENEMSFNSGGSTVWSLGGGLQFRSNNVHDNSSIYDMTALRVDGGNNWIINNRIHHNVADREGAILCTMGKTLIESNLICNNYTLNGNCGATDGGGGIHVAHNNSGIWDSTIYTIRNNVIANNHCAFNGGGIYVYECKVNIVNNHIINNTTQLFGPAIYSLGGTSRLNIQNNYIHGNDYAQFHSLLQMHFSGADSLRLDYNWLDADFTHSVLMNPVVSFLDDTSHNVIGTNAFLVNPTTIAGLGEDATIMDFSLTSQSTELINLGSLSNSYPSLNDYLGNNRVVGLIDIGAFEAVFGGLNTLQDKVQIYPNPAQEFLNIEGVDSGSFSIRSIDGAILKSGVIDAATICLGNIPRGIYLLEINRNFNQEILTKKFTKL